MILEVNRKSRALTKGQFGCLEHIHTLNVTRGCAFRCVYCYARGYPGAPFGNRIHLYANLPERVAREVDNPGRRSAIEWVGFNTASDSFQDHPAILDVSYRTMSVLLERGIGISFLTKGKIPGRFIDLFSRYPDRVMARIGLVSVSGGYRERFEPGTASPAERLRNIRRLRERGVAVEVRADPIIPFYSDDETSIHRLCEPLTRVGVDRVTLSYIHLRPPILKQLERELTPVAYKILASCFHHQPWTVVGASSRTKVIPRTLRKRGYQRFARHCRSYGIRTLICACKNPDMTAQICSAGKNPENRPLFRSDQRAQLSLFGC